MTINLKRAAALFAVMMLAISLVGGAFVGGAAAQTTTLAGDGTDAIDGFNASGDDHLEYSVSSDGTDFGTDSTETLYMNVTYNGEEYAEISAAVDSSTASSQVLNMSHDKLDDLPGDANETTTINVTAWGEGADGTHNTSATEFQVDLTFADSYAVTNVDDDSAEIEDVEASTFARFSGGLFGNDDPADLHTYEQTVGVEGNQTTVTLNDQTTNGTDAFDEAMGDELESGDLITGASAGVDGTPVLAFYESADSDLVEEGDTYAVYEGNGEWTFTLGDDYSDASTVDVYASSQKFTAGDQFSQEDLTSTFIDDAGMSFGELSSNFGFDALTSFNLMDSLGAFSLSDLNPLMLGGDVLTMGLVAPIGIKARRAGA